MSGSNYDQATIQDFFSRERSLCGTHAIEYIQVHTGIMPQDILRIDPNKLPAADECQTIVVKGTFSGKLFVTSNDTTQRTIMQTHPAQLAFNDY